MVLQYYQPKVYKLFFFIYFVVRKTTSIKIDVDLWKKVKIKCINDSLDISDYLEQLIKKDYVHGGKHAKYI